MRHFTSFLFTLPLLLAASGSLAVTSDAAKRSATHTIMSRQLGEPRTLLVRTPPGYRGDRKLPTVFVLDGEWNFDLVASYLDYLADNGVYPRLLVTGVTNVNRNRDFIPRPDKYFSDTGEAEFMRESFSQFGRTVQRQATLRCLYRPGQQRMDQ